MIPLNVLWVHGAVGLVDWRNRVSFFIERIGEMTF
jgi:hypothetical protein